MSDKLNLKEELIKIRRDFHKHAEAGWLEYRTSTIIAEELRNLGYDVYVGKDVCKSSSRMGVPTEEVLYQHEERAIKQGASRNWVEKMRGGHTGVVGVVRGELPGPVIALRFDIDALEILESQSPEHKPNEYNFKSINKEMMHACGHDGHAAIGLGVAKTLMGNKNMLKGEIRLIFQPAEEGCRGAKSLVDNNWLENVDFLYSGHIAFQSFKLGEIVAGVGGFMATTKMDVTYKGKSAHAGNQPEIGKNALLAASATSLHLHSIPRNSQGKTRINVGKLHAGEGRNIIPNKAMFSLETRGETRKLNDYMTSNAIRIIESTAEAYDVQCEWNIVGKAGEETSNKSLTKFITENLKSMDEVTSVVDYRDLGASEDIVYMMEEVHRQGGKASYLLFGSPIPAGHHEPDFDFDEDVLKIAVKVLVQLVFATYQRSDDKC